VNLHQKPPFWLKTLTASRMVWQLPPGNNCVYLTFDDGPNVGATTRALDILKSNNAHATFFVQGAKAAVQPQLIKQILQEGNGLGYHGWQHLDGWKTSLPEYLENTQRQFSSIRLKLFRPPYGRITPQQVLAIRQRDYRIIMWSLSAQDYNTKVCPAKSFAFLKKHVCDGSIVLFHDTITAQPAFTKILELLLDFMHLSGLNAKPLPDAFVLHEPKPSAKIDTFAF